MKLFDHLDADKKEIRNARIQNLGTTPSSPVVGQVYFDTSTSPGRPKIWDGSNWCLSATHLNGVDATATPTASKIVIANGSGKLATGWVSGVLAASDLTNGATGSGSVVLASSPTIVTPTIASFANAPHDHTNAAGGNTLTSAAISNFDTQVRTSRLDQMAAPTAAVSMNSQKLTGLATPTADSDAATKAYADSLASGLDVKGSVRVASTANVSATYNQTGGTSGRGQITGAPNTLDSVTLVAGDRLLLKDQTTGAQNGVYVVTTLGSGSNGVWDRSVDFDSDAEVTSGAFTFVEAGTTNADAGFVLTTNNPITIGGNSGTSLAFAQFSGAGSISAGDGLSKSGNTLSAVGTSNRITVGAGGIDISGSYVGQTSITTVGTIGTGTWNASTIALNKGGTGATDAAGAKTNLGFTSRYAVDVGDGSATSIVVTHNLGTRDVQVSVRDVASPYEYGLPTVQATTTNTVTLTFSPAPTTNQYRVIVTG